jgi:hypothetical protein
LVGAEGLPPPLHLPSVVAPPQQSVVLRASGLPPVALYAMFAWLGGCLFRAPHATGLPAIEVVFPAADIPLRMLELPGLHGDRVTAEAHVVPPRLVVASALESCSATVAVSTASPGMVAAGRVVEFCSSVSRKPSPLVVLTRPRARRACLSPPRTIYFAQEWSYCSSRQEGGTPSITRGQNVVMRQLGVIGTEAAPDATAFQEYLRLFATGLSESHCQAI